MGGQFTAQTWKDHWHLKGVEVRHTSPYHPASNPAEYVMKTLSNYFRLNVRENHRWAFLLADVQNQHNHNVHMTTGEAPITLQWGKEPDQRS